MYDKIFPDNCIILDGRMDEAVWNEVPEYTGFSTRKAVGGETPENQTFLKILPCENRVYFGVKCMDTHMDFVKKYASKDIYQGNSVEVFISPSSSISEIYNFALTIDGLTQTLCFVEGGNNRHIYHPYWHHAVYFGEDYWSVEIEFPLTAFYHTPNDNWSDEWVVNVLRNRPVPNTLTYSGQQVFECSSWAQMDQNFLEMHNCKRVDGMPIRPLRNDIKFTGLALDLVESTEKGYCGNINVTVSNPVADTFVFTSDFSEPVTVQLESGVNNISAPCCVKELIRYNVAAELKRADDGEVFKFYSPITAEFEPIRIAFSLPEYRTNFYPGQDASKIVGKVTAPKPVTLTLEGGGMATQVISPDAEGNFTFETPDFQEGTEAVLTASMDGWEIKKTMRRLAPTGHTMTWVSGGRMIVNGKPIFRRNVCAAYYRGGEAFDRRYRADDLNETNVMNQRFTQPRWLIPNSQVYNASFLGESCQDIAPSAEMLEKLDKMLAPCKDIDYTHNYAYDEPEYHNSSLIYMRKFLDYTAEKDPYHLIRICSHDPDKYMPYCDWIDTDPYMEIKVDKDGNRSFGRPINTLHKFVDTVAKMNRPDKVLGVVTTCFAYKNIGPEFEYPTFDEMLCHAWVFVNHGAKALSSYAYHDMNDRPQLYEGTRYLFASLGALENQILFADFKTLQCDENIDAVLYEYGDDSIFVAANMSDKPQTVTLDGISGTWYHFRHNRTFTGNTFELKPYEVLIGTRQMKDRKLPTYQQTAALIDRLEAERLSNKSLLFDRLEDIEISTQPGQWTRHKLFDGVKDNLACELRGKNLFIELGLKKVAPTFDKIVVSGWHLEDMQIKVCNGDEWTVLTPAKVENQEFSATITLQEAVSADALRFEFPQEFVELYEIELF